MHKCIILMFSDFMSMTFSADIFTVCIYVLACVRLYICMYISMYVFAADVDEHQWYFRMNLLCLLVMYIFVCTYVCICMYNWLYVCICAWVNSISFNSCSKVLFLRFPVPIGRRSPICSTGKGCGRGWEDIVGEARPY